MRPVNNCWWYVWNDEEERPEKIKVDLNELNETVERKMQLMEM